MKTLTLSEYQSHILEMYKKVSVLLDKKNVDYIAVGGTALGALRERGFIPHDDDLDIMIRFDQFENNRQEIILSLEELGFLTTDYIDSVGSYLFKIYSSNKVTVCIARKNYVIRPFIDVFIAVPSHTVEKSEEARLLSKRILKARLFESYRDNNLIVKILTLPYPVKHIQRKNMKRIIKKFFIGGDWTKSWYATYQARPNKYYNMLDIKKVKFEDIEINISADAAEAMERIFGNWRTPMSTHVHIENQLNLQTYEKMLEKKYK